MPVWLIDWSGVCLQDDTYTESYISTIGVDFVSQMDPPPVQVLLPVHPTLQCFAVGVTSKLHPQLCLCACRKFELWSWTGK